MTYIPDKSTSSGESRNVIKQHQQDAAEFQRILIKLIYINKLDNDFKGYLLYKKWDGSVLYGYRIDNGKINTTVKITAKKGQPNRKEKGGATISGYYCYDQCYPVYQWACWGS